MKNIVSLTSLFKFKGVINFSLFVLDRLRINNSHTGVSSLLSPHCVSVMAFIFAVFVLQTFACKQNEIRVRSSPVGYLSFCKEQELFEMVILSPII